MKNKALLKRLDRLEIEINISSLLAVSNTANQVIKSIDDFRLLLSNSDISDNNHDKILIEFEKIYNILDSSDKIKIEYPRIKLVSILGNIKQCQNCSK